MPTPNTIISNTIKVRVYVPAGGSVPIKVSKMIPDGESVGVKSLEVTYCAGAKTVQYEVKPAP